jgi:prevent-host-death family protein
MITIKEDTTLVGVSELRTHIDQILEESKKHKVIIERHNKPVAILMSPERYSQIERILELLEDTALGYLAQERELQSSIADYVDIEQAKMKIK